MNINITYVTPSNTDKTTRIEFTVSFQGTNDNVSGTINVTNDDLTKAYQGATATDPYAGHKALVASKLVAELNQSKVEETK